MAILCLLYIKQKAEANPHIAPVTLACSKGVICQAAGIAGERAASGSFSEAENKPSMRGFTEQANNSEICDNQTEWSRGLNLLVCR
jgi:hypothetical protein